MNNAAIRLPIPPLVAAIVPIVHVLCYVQIDYRQIHSQRDLGLGFYVALRWAGYDAKGFASCIRLGIYAR